MKRRKKKELDKTMGEELLKSEHECCAKVALPLSCKCSGAPVRSSYAFSFLSSNVKGASRVPRVGILNVLCSFQNIHNKSNVLV